MQHKQIAEVAELQRQKSLIDAALGEAHKEYGDTKKADPEEAARLAEAERRTAEEEAKAVQAQEEELAKKKLEEAKKEEAAKVAQFLDITG